MIGADVLGLDGLTDMQRNAALTARLALSFIACIRRDLTPDDLKTVQSRNATPDYAACCASHDFIDANMSMTDAFQIVMGRPPNADSQGDADLINAAWTRARAARFTLPSPD